MNELRIIPAIQELMLPLSISSKRADRHMICRNGAHVNSGSYHPSLGRPPVHYMLFLKTQTEGHCFVSVCRLFQSFVPRKEKDF